MKKIEINQDIFLVEDFFSASKCQHFIQQAQSLDFEEAKVNMGGSQVMSKGVRNNDRLIFFDESLGEQLWLKIKPFVPETIGKYKALGLNEMFRFYRYGAGQRFKMHYDGSYERNETECSFLSFLVYLNEDFEGGETEFRFVETVKPKTGTALVFNHDILHEGKEVTAGIKYVLRTDIMYKLVD